MLTVLHFEYVAESKSDTSKYIQSKVPAIFMNLEIRMNNFQRKSLEKRVDLKHIILTSVLLSCAFGVTQ